MTAESSRSDHDPARPGPADMRASLAAARAILDGAAPGTAHQAAEAGSCPECVAVAGLSFAFTVVSTTAGDEAFMSERTRRVLLAAVDAAQQELDTGLN
jgi:hypothetical protein